MEGRKQGRESKEGRSCGGWRTTTRRAWTPDTSMHVGVLAGLADFEGAGRELGSCAR